MTEALSNPPHTVSENSDNKFRTISIVISWGWVLVHLYPNLIGTGKKHWYISVASGAPAATAASSEGDMGGVAEKELLA